MTSVACISWRPFCGHKGKASNVDAARRSHFHELRSDAGGFEIAADRSVLVHATPAEAEDFLHGNDVLLHAGDFRNRDNPAAPVFLALGLDHDIDRGGDLLA